jgi:aspartyl-tRNA(Asn)/glutamyl-tRNA(Gln) amidotransferase subunit A
MQEPAAQYMDESVPVVFEEAIVDLEAAGATLVGIELPFFDEGQNITLIALFSEAVAYQQKNLQGQWDSFQQVTRIGFASGFFSTAADYLTLQRARRMIRRRVEAMMTDIDVDPRHHELRLHPLLVRHRLPRHLTEPTHA